NLMVIYKNRQGRFMDYRVARYILADDLFQKFFHLCDHQIQVHRLFINRLFPAEQQQFLRETGRPIGSFEHALDIVPQRIVCRHFQQGKLSVTDDGRKDVVEIMSNPAGQGADGLHPLSMMKLLLQLSMFSEITLDGNKVRNLAIGFLNRRDGLSLWIQSAVFMPIHYLPAPDFTFENGIPQLFEERLVMNP